MDGAFRSLERFSVWHNSGMRGPVPAKWGSSGRSLQKLFELSAAWTGLTGTLPPEWSSQLPSLGLLYLDGGHLTGVCVSS